MTSQGAPFDLPLAAEMLASDYIRHLRATAFEQQKRAGYAAWGAMWRSAMMTSVQAPSEAK